MKKVFSGVPGMSTMNIDRFRQAVLDLFAEAYEGPAEAWTWFVTYGDPNAGLFGTLAQLTAREASTPAIEAGNTIAAHTENLRWSLAFANTYFRGEVPEQGWEQSWAVQTVDDEQWKRLQAELRRQYHTLYQAIERHSDWSDEMFLRGTMATIPHAAYHLRAIRQLVRILRGSPKTD